MLQGRTRGLLRALVSVLVDATASKRFTAGALGLARATVTRLLGEMDRIRPEEWARAEVIVSLIWPVVGVARLSRQERRLLGLDERGGRP